MSPTVDFYVLQHENPKSRFAFACRLLEKAYAQKNKVFVQTESQHDAHIMDDQLWTYRQESFIPHNLQGEGPDNPPPIQIGFSDHATGFHDILLNLSTTVPAFHTQFKRIIHIVCADPAIKATSREHYRFYQEQGFKVQSHNISS